MFYLNQPCSAFSVLDDWYCNNQPSAWKTFPHKLVVISIHQDFVEITCVHKLRTRKAERIYLKWVRPGNPEMCKDKRIQWNWRKRGDWCGLSKIWGAVSRIGGEIGDWSLVWPPSSFFFLKRNSPVEKGNWSWSECLRTQTLPHSRRLVVCREQNTASADFIDSILSVFYILSSVIQHILNILGHKTMGFWYTYM